MATPYRWSHLLDIAGLVAMIAGALDPLEGSVVVLAGAASLTIGATIAQSRQAPRLWLALGLIVAGVAALWGFSALGGIGGTSGRSMWWGLTMLPFPIGWVVGLIGGWRRMQELRLLTAKP
jgi:hypothetical protein